MKKLQGSEAAEAGVRLIQEQLQVIPVSLANILHSPRIDTDSLDAIASSMQLPRTRRSAQTGSVGNIIKAESRSDMRLDFKSSYHPMQEDAGRKQQYLRVVIGNALLAVGAFFREYGMADMRTPEVQFLGHVYNALLNGNRLTIKPGYNPIAAFDGLVINSSVDGMPLFAEGGAPGLMEFGDAVALLQWLALYLRGGEHFETGGDAG